MRSLRLGWFVLLSLIVAAPVFAQSPNTAAIVVVVTDQTGGVVKDAKVTVTNAGTSASRDAVSGADGSVTIPALSIMGTYTVSVTKQGFTSEDTKNLTLRAGETAQLAVKLVATGGSSSVTVYGTTEGLRQDPQLGTRLDSATVNETPIFGRKITALPLLDASFRPAKGTGDLFINSVYFVSGAGGRRQPDYVIDGATGDEPWGRQTMFSTIPVGAIEDLTVSSTSFSAEYGWTSGPAINIVTKSGTNTTQGDGLFMGRPSTLEATSFSAGALCPPSIPSCQATTTAGVPITAISPADTPDTLEQTSLSAGGALKKDKTFYFAAFDYANQNRTAPLTTSLAATPTYTGNYQQALVDTRIDHNLSATNRLMFRFNLDRFFDNNPQDAVSAAVLPAAARVFDRHTYSFQGGDTTVLGNSMINEARYEYQDARPVTDFDPVTPSPQFTRGGSTPFTVGESRFAHVYSSQGQFSDTLSWTKGKHYVRVGGSLAHATSGGDGTEFGSAYVDGQFTFSTSGAAGALPISALTLANVSSYVQTINFCASAVPGNDKIGTCTPGANGIATYQDQEWIYDTFVQDSYRLRNDLTIDAGLRYDRQTLSDGTDNFAPRIGFAWNPKGDANTVIRGGYGIYYTMLRSNNAASFVLGGPDGVFTYSAAPGQTGFPTCLPTIDANGVPESGCAPVVFNANAALSTLPARNITIRPGEAAFYTQDFANYGVDFTKLTDYPSALVNPKSQVGSIGIEREFAHKVFFSADYVTQRWTNLDETVDLNAPSVFDRTAPGQTRSVAAADATRPIVPVNGGFRTISVIENLGTANYNALQTSISYKGSSRWFASLSYTLSKSTNTTEPDGNGAGPNDFNQLSAQFEEGPSLLDQRHRAVATVSYRLPWYGLTAGTVNQFASARPFNATTGVDDNGDGSRTDRPVINGSVVGRDAFRGTPIYETDIFIEGQVTLAGHRALTLRLEGFNIFNHANILSRNGSYGDTATPAVNFGQPGSGTTATINGVVTALPGLANIDPSRMFQLSARFTF